MLSPEHADVHMLSCPMDALNCDVYPSRLQQSQQAQDLQDLHAMRQCIALRVPAGVVKLCCGSDICRLPGMAHLLHGSLSLPVAVLPDLLELLVGCPPGDDEATSSSPASH